MKRNDVRINERTKKKRAISGIRLFCIYIVSQLVLTECYILQRWITDIFDTHKKLRLNSFRCERAHLFAHGGCMCVRAHYPLHVIVSNENRHNICIWLQHAKKEKKKIEPNNIDYLKKQHFNNWLENFIRYWLILHEWILLLLLSHRLFFWLRTATKQKLTVRLIPIIYAFNFLIDRDMHANKIINSGIWKSRGCNFKKI